MGKKMETVTDFIFLGSKVTADGGYSYEIKRCLPLGRKTMTNLDSILKIRNITLPTKVHIVKAMIFLIVMWGCESCIIMKAEHRKIDAFKLWCWRRPLRVPGTARRSNQSILKEISPEYSLEGLTMKVKLQYFGHLMQRIDSKDPDAGKNWRPEEKGVTEDEMTEWHHQLNGHEFEQTSGDSEGQRSLACCSPWGHKESDATEWLHNDNPFLQASRPAVPELISVCAQRGEDCLFCIYIHRHICPPGTRALQAASSTEQPICSTGLVEV